MKGLIYVKNNRIVLFNQVVGSLSKEDIKPILENHYKKYRLLYDALLFSKSIYDIKKLESGNIDSNSITFYLKFNESKDITYINTLIDECKDRLSIYNTKFTINKKSIDILVYN